MRQKLYLLYVSLIINVPVNYFLRVHVDQSTENLISVIYNHVTVQWTTLLYPVKQTVPLNVLHKYEKYVVHLFGGEIFHDIWV